MAKRLSPHFINLIYEAALNSFWRKRALRRFLRTCGISEGFLSTWSSDETKREFLDRLFAKLQDNPKGQGALLGLARALAEQTSFPDLDNWEDSSEKKERAAYAVSELRSAFSRHEGVVQKERAREGARRQIRERQAELRRAETDLQQLSDRLAELATQIGTQKAGYGFQDWFFDLLDFSEIINRRPYSHGGRQIDGSLTLADTTYLIELKFTSEQSSVTDVDAVLVKIKDKAENTMGIMVSMSGFSSVATKQASGPRTPLLLLDHRHLYLVLGGTMTFQDLIERVRRHASQTGEALLDPERFGNV